MNPIERQTLADMLSNLLSAQDVVTHYNETNQIASCKVAQVRRDRIKHDILDFVDEMISLTRRQAQGG